MGISQKISNRELVVYVLSTMGSLSERHHTEAIAIKCHELYPTVFSWETNPELPDKETVRASLGGARRREYGPELVESRTRDGWKLTEAGWNWVQANRHRFKDVPPPRDHRQKSRRLLKRVRDHRLFRAFTDDPDAFRPEVGPLADLAQCRVDAESHVWQKRFQRLKEMALETEQPDLQQFIEACEKLSLDNFD
jgi:hypothetical protein